MRRTGAASGLQWSGLLAMLAAVLFPPLFIVGLVLLCLGFVRAREFVCSCCGNKVVETSTLCPTCRASLREEPSLPWGWLTLILVALMVAGFVYVQPEMAKNFVTSLRAILAK